MRSTLPPEPRRLAGPADWRHREILVAGVARPGLPLLTLPPGSGAACIVTGDVPGAFDVWYAAVKDQGYRSLCRQAVFRAGLPDRGHGELADDKSHGFLEILQWPTNAAATP